MNRRILSRGIVIPMLVTLCASALADAPELHPVSSGLNNRDLTISPGGDLLFTTIMAPANQYAVIVMSRKIDGAWADLEIAPFSGEFPDIEPMFDPSGKKLFFSSRRPRPGREGDDWDIWVTERADGEWSEPRNLGTPINTAGNEFYPSIAANGNLYFTAEREGRAGAEDIWRAIYKDGQYISVAPLGDGVNSEHFEFNAFVSPNEQYVIFSSQGRDGELGRGDLYISRKSATGEFSAAERLPAGINSPSLDYCPFVRESRLYFTSRRTVEPGIIDSYRELRDVLQAPGNGMGDIYSIKIDLEDQP